MLLHLDKQPTAIFVSIDGKPAGIFAISDPVKSTTPDTISVLHRDGIRIVMLTGDNRTTSSSLPPAPRNALTLELSLLRDRQAAAGDILRIISSSSHDVRPVFEAIAESAARLCRAQFGIVYRFDGALLHFVAPSVLSTSPGAECKLNFLRCPDHVCS